MQVTLRGSVLFDRYGYMGSWWKTFYWVYSPQYITKVMFHNLGNFCNYIFIIFFFSYYSSLLVILWIIIFATKLRFGRKRLSHSLIKKNISLKLAKFLSRPDHRIQFIAFISWKKYFLRCAKISFFRIFWKFQILTYETKWNKLNSVVGTVFSDY